VCEVWKWIAIITAIPLVVTWLFGEPITFLWFVNADLFPRLRRITYSPWWWTACVVVVISTTTYVSHCT
jgi:hypothetical protein